MPNKITELWLPNLYNDDKDSLLSILAINRRVVTIQVMFMMLKLRNTELETLGIASLFNHFHYFILDKVF